MKDAVRTSVSSSEENKVLVNHQEAEDAVRLSPPEREAVSVRRADRHADRSTTTTTVKETKTSVLKFFVHDLVSRQQELPGCKNHHRSVCCHFCGANPEKLSNLDVL